MYYTILYCTVLYCTVLYCTVLYCTVLYCTVLYCTVLFCTVLYYTVLYYTVLYCTVLYCTTLYYTVLYCVKDLRIGDGDSFRGMWVVRMGSVGHCTVNRSLEARCRIETNVTSRTGGWWRNWSGCFTHLQHGPRNLSFQTPDIIVNQNSAQQWLLNSLLSIWYLNVDNILKFLFEKVARGSE